MSPLKVRPPPESIRSLSLLPVENASVLSAGLNIAAAVVGVDTSPEKSMYV